MNICEQLKQDLIEDGLDATRDNSKWSGHLARCAECNALLDAYAAIPELLDSLPEIAPPERLAGQTEQLFEPAEQQTSVRSWRFGPAATGMATAVVLLAVVGLSRELFRLENPEILSRQDQFAIRGRPQSAAEPAAPVVADSPPVPMDYEGKEGVSDLRLGEDRFEHTAPDGRGSLADVSSGPNPGYADDDLELRRLKQGKTKAVMDSNRASERDNKPARNAAPAPALSQRQLESQLQAIAKIRLEEGRRRDARLDGLSTGQADSADQYTEGGRQLAGAKATVDNHRPVDVLTREFKQNQSLERGRIAAGDHAEKNRVLGGNEDPLPSSDLRSQDEVFKKDKLAEGEYRPRYSQSSATPVTEQGASESQRRFANAEAGAVPKDQLPAEESLSELVHPTRELSETDLPAVQVNGVVFHGGGFTTNHNGFDFADVAGFDFLNHYQQTDNLVFQQSTGYWANSYVPGDPEIRLLRARLAKWDRSQLLEAGRLEQDVTPVTQPFDAPADNALALSLMADAKAVDGPTRMRLQVGIQGIEHLRGQRPAMNLGIVFDLPDQATDADRIAARALLDALLEAKQAGDRFSLVLSGWPEEQIIAADDFRYGPLQVARQAILGEEQAAAGEALDLPQAVKQAAALVKAGDDPSRPLGSSSVLLISAGALESYPALVDFAHLQASDGITTSVFPLGDQPAAERVEQIVLAGLGNRRFLESPDQAQALIGDELYTASRAVARAARLSIRLAPGVKLIDVIGSQRLDVEKARQVKQIEQSMDQRLSANLGIQADRGEDEDGIQIVIPSIFAGDSLTILLDVLVDRPGAVADVSLRYKDLVYLKNSSLRDRLSLEQGTVQRGLAELTVLKNLLAWHFSHSVQQAADYMARQQPEAAASTLASMRQTLLQLRSELPGWDRDPELKRDQQVLARYLQVLVSPQAQPHRILLADSLRYAAWAKTHRPLVEWQQ